MTSSIYPYLLPSRQLVYVNRDGVLVTTPFGIARCVNYITAKRKKDYNEFMCELELKSDRGYATQIAMIDSFLPSLDAAVAAANFFKRPLCGIDGHYYEITKGGVLLLPLDAAIKVYLAKAFKQCKAMLQEHYSN